MTTKTNLLASGKAARLVFGAVAATALTAASATPALANDHRDRGGIGAGEIIAGAVVIGGLAALAGAFDNDRDDRRYDYRDRDFRGGWDRGGFGNPRTAVDRCVRAAENGHLEKPSLLRRCSDSLCSAMSGGDDGWSAWFL